MFSEAEGITPGLHMARSGALWLGRRKLLEDLSSTRFSSLGPSRHILVMFYSQWFRQNSLIVERK